MLQSTIFGLLVVALLPALAAQVPLDSGQRPRPPTDHVLGGNDSDELAEWNLNTRPSPNATEHLVFETVHSFLQHWPNTRMRNGHNIVPGRIPKGTLLYHGTNRNELPKLPDWVATDPEHSYLFCRNFSMQTQSGCWHLTLMTTRPLKVIYFDGSSAAKIPYGPLDTQDLIAWGKVGSDVFSDERRRIIELCAWGRNFDVDGFVRMEMDFEVMLCDFTSGVNVVSFLNLVSRSFIPIQPTSFEVMNAGSWHNRFPGETRIQLDLSRLVSFYDTQLVPSLIPFRFGQERWDHRAGNASSEDITALKSTLEENIMRPDHTSSGIDWKTLVQVVVDRYAERLELTRHLVNLSTTNSPDVLDLAKKAQTQLRIMLTPYLLFSATPSDADETALDWAIPIYKLCATTHTRAMESQFESMTDSEKLLLQAIRTTTREICRVVTRMWVAGVYAGIDPSLNTSGPNDDTSEVAWLLEAWAEELDDLMGWLDWNVWIKCDPGCGPEEMCYLPTWPAGFPRHGGGRGPGRNFPPPPPPGSEEPPAYPGLEILAADDVRSVAMETFAEEMESVVQPDPDEWVRPQPRCIRRVEPYDL